MWDVKHFLNQKEMCQNIKNTANILEYENKTITIWIEKNNLRIFEC